MEYATAPALPPLRTAVAVELLSEPKLKVLPPLLVCGERMVGTVAELSMSSAMEVPPVKAPPLMKARVVPPPFSCRVPVKVEKFAVMSEVALLPPTLKMSVPPPVTLPEGLVPFCPPMNVWALELPKIVFDVPSVMVKAYGRNWLAPELLVLMVPPERVTELLAAPNGVTMPALLRELVRLMLPSCTLPVM